MTFKKSHLISLIFSIFFINSSYAGISWTPVENTSSNMDRITGMTTYHDRVYFAGFSESTLCTFVYAEQSANKWLSVSNGLVTPTSCIEDIQSFVTYHDQLFAGGLSGFFVYNGNDLNPNWTSLGTSGLPSFQPRLTHLTVFQDKIYGIATNGEGDEMGVYVFNGVTKTWTNLSASIPPSPIIGPESSFVVFNNKLYWFHTYQAIGSAVHSDIFVYNGNDAAPSWSTVFKSPDNRIFSAIDIFDNTLVVGGNTSFNGTALMLAYNGNDAMPQWTDISGVNGALKNLSLGSIGHDDHSLFIGGSDVSSSLALIYQFNGDFKNPNWIEADTGIDRSVMSFIGYFTNTNHGLFTADISGCSDLFGSVVYKLGN